MAPGLTDMLKGLLGGGAKASEQAQPADTVDYKGFAIVPAPRPDKGVYYVAGSIALIRDGETLEHHFVRADSSTDREQTIELTVIKAKQMIDLEGERLFSRGSDPSAG